MFAPLGDQVGNLNQRPIGRDQSPFEDLFFAQRVMQRIDHLIPKSGQLRTDRNVTTPAHTARSSGRRLEQIEPGKADQVAQSPEFLGTEDIRMFEVCPDERRFHVLQRQDRVAYGQADVSAGSVTDALTSSIGVSWTDVPRGLTMPYSLTYRVQACLWYWRRRCRRCLPRSAWQGRVGRRRVDRYRRQRPGCRAASGLAGGYGRGR
jgi:hypothetical protein